MLVITRKQFETIVIHTDQGTITVKVLHTKGSSARIGIDCPMEMKVLRGELDSDGIRQEIEDLERKILLQGELVKPRQKSLRQRRKTLADAG